MKKMLLCLTALIATTIVYAQTEPSCADFTGQALRIEIYLTGDAKTDTVTVGQMIVDPIWAGPLQEPSFPFKQGAYVVSFYDQQDDRLLFSKGFDCLYGEYKTTAPALQGIAKTFQHSLVMPCPKRPGRLVLEQRDRRQQMHKLLEQAIDPADYHIAKRGADRSTVFTIQENGAPDHKVDLLFLAEGYSAAEQDKFKADAERYAGILLACEPYKRHSQDFNIRAMFLPSAESGMDEPRQLRYRDTALDASFNALDLDRYMLTEAGHRLRRLAGSVPYDTLVILVNSQRYGGGGIYNDYSINTVDHEISPLTFLHEFGHNFAGLADEYYSSEVAYNDFYPQGIEPLEPNITALLDPGRLKWKALLSPGVPLPTPWGKTEREALQKQLWELRAKLEADLKAAGDDSNRQKTIRAGHEKTRAGLEKKLKAVEKKFAARDTQVGAFEGAGYSSTGLYRPMTHCLMHSNHKNEFCRVCQDAIERTILYYSQQTVGR